MLSAACRSAGAYAGNDNALRGRSGHSTAQLRNAQICNHILLIWVGVIEIMATSFSTCKDWLGKDSEIQFFFHSSRTKPLTIIGVEDTSQHTIQVEVKPLRSNEVNNPCMLDYVCFISTSTANWCAGKLKSICKFVSTIIALRFCNTQ